MSTAYSSAKQQYIGNGVTTEWGFDFPIKKHSELKVYLKRSNSTQVLLEEGVDYSFVTDNTITFPIKTGEAKLQASDVLALQRESVFESEYNFSNQQRLEPEEVMHADDNLERQIQELKRDVTQAIRIQPTSNINTDEYFIAVESIYENSDNINNVSGISAEIVNCSDNISDISTVSSNIANVNAVGQSISDVNTVASNVSSVNTVAGVSTDVTAVAGISTDVSTVANNSANVTTVATNISDVNTAATNIEAIKAATTAATNAAQSATNAANSATDSANSATASATSANNSHIWAEGTDAQVQALGGVHSSKGWAEQSTNANIALTNSPYTTNRILEIPKDIKLELNNGTLTLKAGSKVYVPNGFEADGTTPKFDVKTVPNDLSWTFNQTNALCSVTPENTRNTVLRDYCFSGSTAPTSFQGGQYAIWYDTTNNFVKFTNDAGSTWSTGTSLPYTSISSDNSYNTFNGFGYIGSTVFALPGVKVQAPNGKDSNGRYLNRELNITQVTCSTVSSNVTRGCLWFFIYDDNGIGYVDTFGYDSEHNYSLSGTKPFSGNALCTASATNGVLSNFKPYQVDSVANSNASNFSQAGRSYLSGLGMPSNRYIDLTLGASGSSYTAPANGYFVVTATSTSASRALVIFEKSHGICNGDHSYSSETGLLCFVPCQKGKSTSLIYGGATITGLWFVYAEGEN